MQYISCQSFGFFSFIPKRTCWARHIKSVDGFVLFRLSYFDNSDLIAIVCHFYIRGRFFGHISWKVAENSASEPSNLKIFWGRAPRPPYKNRAFRHLRYCPPSPPPPPPPKKKKKKKLARPSNNETRTKAHGLKLSFVFIYTILTLIE